MYHVVNKEKYCQICKYPVWFYFNLHVRAHFGNEIEIANYKSHLNVLTFYDQWNLMSDLNMCHGKMSDFISFPLFGLALVIKMRKFGF